MIEILSGIFDIAFLPLSIFIVLTLHEFGHYLAARFFNIGVESFSLGYGDNLWSRRDRHGTEWIIKLFPICGHVSLSHEKKEHAKGTVFNEAPVWQRVVVIAAGPAMNILTAFLFIFLFFAIYGQPSKYAVVGGVEPEAPAWEAGLKTGDRFIEIEGKPVLRYRDVWHYTYKSPEQPLAVKVRRGDEIVETTLTPMLAEYKNRDGIDKSHSRIGILAGANYLNLSALGSINGVNLGKGDHDKARALLIENLGKEVMLGIKSDDGLVRTYQTLLSPELNAHLSDPDNPQNVAFYAGPVKDNFYLQRDITNSQIQAIKQVALLVSAVAQLPFQLFPVDRENIRPWAVVLDPEMDFERRFYGVCFRLALISVLIALVNLVPFPGLDGSMLVLNLLESRYGRDTPAMKRAYKYILLGSLIALYGGVLVANVDNFPAYLHNIAGDILPPPR